jgi:putative sterol carrier protein
MTLPAGQLIQNMLAEFPPEKAVGLDAEVQLNLTGEGGGDWILKIAKGQISAKEGKAASPQLTITAPLADVSAIAGGQLDPMAAFMKGKIKLSGDVGLAMRMVTFFKKS